MALDGKGKTRTTEIKRFCDEYLSPFLNSGFSYFISHQVLGKFVSTGKLSGYYTYPEWTVTIKLDNDREGYTAIVSRIAMGNKGRYTKSWIISDNKLTIILSEIDRITNKKDKLKIGFTEI